MTRKETPVSAAVYLSTRDAADYTGIGKSSFDKWRTVGSGPPHIKICRRVHYRRDLLDAWLSIHARNSTSEALDRKRAIANSDSAV